MLSIYGLYKCQTVICGSFQGEIGGDFLFIPSLLHYFGGFLLKIGEACAMNDIVI